jgi:hypothetical protein
MSSLSYELLINLKQLDVIAIRQSSFFQIRVTVMQSTSKDVPLSVSLGHAIRRPLPHDEVITREEVQTSQKHSRPQQHIRNRRA